MSGHPAHLLRGPLCLMSGSLDPGPWWPPAPRALRGFSGSVSAPPLISLTPRWAVCVLCSVLHWWLECPLSAVGLCPEFLGMEEPRLLLWSCSQGGGREHLIATPPPRRCCWYPAWSGRAAQAPRPALWTFLSRCLLQTRALSLLQMKQNSKFLSSLRSACCCPT